MFDKVLFCKNGSVFLGRKVIIEVGTRVLWFLHWSGEEGGWCGGL